MSIKGLVAALFPFGGLRHRLAAGLHEPLRVILYDEKGDAIFEFDKPSSLFGQFGDEQVSAVGPGLDANWSALCGEPSNSQIC
jgi:hypothetical protein